MNIRFVLLAALFAVSVFLTGCPVSTEYPLGDRSSALPFDASMIGTWVNDSKEADKSEASKVVIEKGSSSTIYKVTVKQKGEAFMADSDLFDAWVTELNGKKFLVLQEVHGSTRKNVFFVYCIANDGADLVTENMNLQEKGADAIVSIKTYRDEVQASMKHDDFLTGKITWKKQ